MASVELTYICILLNIDEDPHSLTHWESRVPVTLIWLSRPHLSGKLHSALRNSKPIRSLWIPVTCNMEEGCQLNHHTAPQVHSQLIPKLFNSSHTLFMFHSLQPTLCSSAASEAVQWPFVMNSRNYLTVCAAPFRPTPVSPASCPICRSQSKRIVSSYYLVSLVKAKQRHHHHHQIRWKGEWGESHVSYRARPFNH